MSVSESSCPSCGASTAEGVKFCGQCGFAMRATGAPEPPPPLDPTDATPLRRQAGSRDVSKTVMEIGPPRFEPGELSAPPKEPEPLTSRSDPPVVTPGVAGAPSDVWDDGAAVAAASAPAPRAGLAGDIAAGARRVQHTVELVPGASPPPPAGGPAGASGPAGVAAPPGRAPFMKTMLLSPEPSSGPATEPAPPTAEPPAQAPGAASGFARTMVATPEPPPRAPPGPPSTSAPSGFAETMMAVPDAPAAVVAPAAPPSQVVGGAPPSSRPPQRTMMGIDGAEPRRPSPSSRPPPRRAIQHTMMGVPKSEPPIAAAAPVEPAASAPASPSPQPPPGRKPQRTMMGMPLAAPPASAAPPSPAAAPLPVEASPPPAAPAAAPLPVEVSPSPSAPRPVPGGPSPAVVEATSGPRSRPSRGTLPAATNRTMLGMAAIRHEAPRPGGAPASAAHAPAPAARPEPRAPSESLDSFPDIPGLPRRRSGARGALVAVVVLLVLLALVGAAVGVTMLLGGRGPDIRARVTQTEQGEALLVEVPGAAEGAKVRFAGQEAPLDAGRASFPIRADDLRIGDNVLALAVVDPDGTARDAELTLRVDYRVRADLGGLAEDPAAVVLVVDAAPGAEVTLDGEPFPIDGSGHAERRYELPATDEGNAFEQSVRYRVVLPSGEVGEGAVETRIPYAALQVDRPGPEAITDRAEIEVAGGVHETASVTIGGAPVAVTDRRFLHRFPLPEARDYEIVVVARQPGRAPRRRALTVRRVEDLVAEADRYETDDSLTYGRISQNPSIYRGQRVELTGRVYNVSVQAGRSNLQMLVRDCPRGQRCPLWVTLPQATDVEEDSWVRVLGTVAGEQQFRSESDRIVTVPRVDAVFLLPERP